MLQQLKAERITAMKAKDVVAKNILSYLLSEAQGIAKTEQREVTDNDVIETSKALIKKNQNLIDLQDGSAQLERENEILKGFTPQQYTEDQQKSIIDVLHLQLPESDKGNGAIKKLMPLLKEHGDMIDKRTASMYIKEKSAKFEADKAEKDKA